MSQVRVRSNIFQEIGDVENWSRSIEADMRTISSALEYVYKGVQSYIMYNLLLYVYKGVKAYMYDLLISLGFEMCIAKRFLIVAWLAFIG